MKTDMLFEKYSYIKEFAATVISCEEEEKEIDGKKLTLYAVGLDATAFFPEGGGQPADGGTLGTLKVYDVQRTGDLVLHYVDEPMEEGTQVVGVIDFETRFRRMQNHIGEHLICGLIHNAYGYNNVGFHLTDELVTMDVDGPLTAEQIKEIEERANEVIAENVPITVTFPTPEELKNMTYRSKLDLDSGVRIVTIEGYDVCACCAPQPAFTGEIEIIKIVDFLPHRGGMRLFLRCGKDAYLDYVALHENNGRIMRALSSKRLECADAVEKMCQKLKEEKERAVALEKQIAELHLSIIKEKLKKFAGDENSKEVIFLEGICDIQVRNIINEGVKLFPGVLIVFIKKEDGGYRFIASRKDENVGTPLPVMAVSMNEALNGRGGGSNKMIQGSVAATREQIENYFNL